MTDHGMRHGHPRAAARTDDCSGAGARAERYRDRSIGVFGRPGGHTESRRGALGDGAAYRPRGFRAGAAP